MCGVRASVALVDGGCARGDLLAPRRGLLRSRLLAADHPRPAGRLHRTSRARRRVRGEEAALILLRPLNPSDQHCPREEINGGIEAVEQWAMGVVRCATLSGPDRAFRAVGAEAPVVALRLCPQHWTRVSFELGPAPLALHHAGALHPLSVANHVDHVPVLVAGPVAALTAERLSASLSPHFPLPLGIFYARTNDDADEAVAAAVAVRFVLRVQFLVSRNQAHLAHYARMRGAVAGGPSRLRFALHREATDSAYEGTMTVDALGAWIHQQLAGVPQQRDVVHTVRASFEPRSERVTDLGADVSRVEALARSGTPLMVLYYSIACEPCRHAHLAFHRAAESVVGVQWAQVQGRHPRVRGVPAVVSWTAAGEAAIVSCEKTWPLLVAWAEKVRGATADVPVEYSA